MFKINRDTNPQARKLDKPSVNIQTGLETKHKRHQKSKVNQHLK